MLAGPDLSVYPAAGAEAPTGPGAALVLAPGAGAGRLSAFMVGMAHALAAHHMPIATFDFPYRTQGRKVPDRGPVLEEAWRQAIASVRAREEFANRPLFIGGKSMGGRIASQVAAADGEGVAGLVLLGYPLHPPGRPGQRRDAHLPAISAPVLFVQGSRDALGAADEIRALLPRLRDATLHVVEDGDHSFKQPASRRTSPDAVLGEVAAVVAAWIRGQV